MKVLVTGAGGFMGQNLCAALRNIRDGKDRTRPALRIDELMECGRDTPAPRLAEYCARADFVFHLAGVNRAEDSADFWAGNAAFTSSLLAHLSSRARPCPVMYASSVWACRAPGEPYGASKRAAEELVFSYAEQSGAAAMVYRFPNVFGKWCRPDYNSVVATFCHRIARGQPIRMDDPERRLELVYIDDLVEELLDALEGRPHWAGAYCFVPTTHSATLGEIAALLRVYHDASETRFLPPMAEHSFEKKLYSTYLSYLPAERVSVPLKTNTDARGSFTEILKTADHGQVSVNVAKPGVTKGQHWHRSKWEMFVVVSGHGVIRQRKIGSEDVIETEVCGRRPQCVYMLPGYTHSITNLSQTDDLVTLIWANEPFDSAHPDTYFEEV